MNLERPSNGLTSANQNSDGLGLHDVGKDISTAFI